MSNPVWPPDVPMTITLSSANEQWIDGNVVSEMDKGEPHERPGSSLWRTVYSGNIVMTKAEAALWKTFVKSSLSNKSRLVDGFRHPREGTTLDNVRIESAGAPKPISTDLYEIAITVSWYE